MTLPTADSVTKAMWSLQQSLEYLQRVYECLTDGKETDIIVDLNHASTHVREAVDLITMALEQAEED